MFASEVKSPGIQSLVESRNGQTIISKSLQKTWTISVQRKKTTSEERKIHDKQSE
jgi:hypothetical protein